MASCFRWIGKSPDGETVTLKKFSGEFRTAEYATPDWLLANGESVRAGVALDTETTGLNRRGDAIIEIGLRAFRFNKTTGDLLALGESYSGLEDPGRPLSDEVKILTGLRTEDLRGKKIDWIAVDRMLGAADIILAHNAGFDRPFVEKKSEAAREKPWGCSQKQIDWTMKGFGSSKLELLSIYHGFFTDAHRALSDVDALLHLLSMQDTQTARPYLNELLITARRPMVRVFAVNSPFESKDLLKDRGYSWDLEKKVWSKSIYKESAEAEMAWLESAVYSGSSRGLVEEIALNQLFK